MKRTPWIGLLLALLLVSCGESHFLTDQSYREKVEEDFYHKWGALASPNLYAIFNAPMTLPEREAMLFLYAYMPINDLVDYPATQHLQSVQTALKARKEMSWGNTVPEDLFRHFVLPQRVDNETLDNFRITHYEALKSHVKGMSMEEAATAIDEWCSQQPNTAETDRRKATTLVAALRTVGIPARRVFPAQAGETNDNAAWVEKWVDGKWSHTNAQGGQLIISRAYGRYEGAEEKIAYNRCFAAINLTDNYAPTAKATVRVVDGMGIAISNATVRFGIFDRGGIRFISTKYTDAQGEVSIRAAQGDMIVWANFDDHFSVEKLSFALDTENELILTPNIKEGSPLALDFDLNLPEAYTRSSPSPSIQIETPAANLSLEGNIDEVLLSKSKENPEILVSFFSQLPLLDDYNPLSIPVSQTGVWTIKAGDEQSLASCFVALCRHAGIQARINPIDNQPQYYANDRWVRARIRSIGGENPRHGTVRIDYTSTPDNLHPRYGSDFTLAHMEQGVPSPLDFAASQADDSFNALFAQPQELEVGHYIILSGRRSTAETIRCHIQSFSIEQGKESRTKLIIP